MKALSSPFSLKSKYIYTYIYIYIHILFIFLALYKYFFELVPGSKSHLYEQKSHDFFFRVRASLIISLRWPILQFHNLFMKLVLDLSLHITIYN
jgi:hypothetical protein